MKLLRPYIVLCLALLALPSVFTSCHKAPAVAELKVQADYPELPAIRQGAVYSDRLATVRRIALEDEQSGTLAPGSYDQTVALLTSANVYYQTDLDGREVACIPLLASMIDRDATRGGSERMQQIFDSAYQDGLRIIPMICDVARASGFYLDGLENAVKSASHTIDKANRWLEWWRGEYNLPEATVEDVADAFTDMVRFSALTTKEQYVSATHKLIQCLQDSGYTVVKVDNRFLDREGKQDFNRTYRAVHLTVRTGHRDIEIQVHDVTSQKIRTYTHEIYETMRQLDENSDEYKELAQKCIDAWKDYENPKGIEDIK